MNILNVPFKLQLNELFFKIGIIALNGQLVKKLLTSNRLSV
jgi:hypothetical protein